MRNKAARALRAGVDQSVGVVREPIKTLSPKRPVSEQSGLADLFPYYAGFSYGWARDRLESFDLPTTAVVLDPWNGSGTTLMASQAVGLASIGTDLNPVACAVASLKAHGAGLPVDLVDAPLRAEPIDGREPLLAWFSPRVAERMRGWADAGTAGPSCVSTLVVKLSLFRVVRSLTKGFEGSNPTWVRIGRSSEECVDIGIDEIDELVIRQQMDIASRLEGCEPVSTSSCVAVANADRLPLPTGAIDGILTSPPYLTRIDYAVAYSRELAVLGIEVGRDRSRQSRSLREQLMGTTLIRRSANSLPSLGSTANGLLKQVADHPSKASGGYYLKQIRQYLEDFTNSLEELTRVAKVGALMTLVVQDSYYKDVLIPLATICIEEAESRGWSLVGEPAEYTVKRHLTQLNTAARAYPKGKVAESVITLRRSCGHR